MAMLTLAVVRIALPYCWAMLPLNVVVLIAAMQPVRAAAEAESTACKLLQMKCSRGDARHTANNGFGQRRTCGRIDGAPQLRVVVTEDRVLDHQGARTWEDVSCTVASSAACSCAQTLRSMASMTQAPVRQGHCSSVR